MVERRLGSVRISPQVLATLARLTVLGQPGVVDMYSDMPSGMDRLIHGKGSADGVRISVVDGAVSVDIHIVALGDANLYELGRELQACVGRAIKEMVGMPVLGVNVHVEDVVMSGAEAS